MEGYTLLKEEKHGLSRKPGAYSRSFCEQESGAPRLREGTSAAATGTLATASILFEASGGEGQERDRFQLPATAPTLEY